MPSGPLLNEWLLRVEDTPPLLKATPSMRLCHLGPPQRAQADSVGGRNAPRAWNRCLGSSRRGSILAGALKPRQTTKISALVLREAAGLVASTLSNSCLNAYSSAL